MPFQTIINPQQSPAVEGDFASKNPRATVLAGEGALIAASTGVTVGRFAWAASGLAASLGSGVPSGFVHRESQALITTYLAEFGMTIPQGLVVILHSAGDFWAKTLTVATVGQKVFASNTTGQISTGTAGATISGSTETKFSVGSAGAVGELIKITTWA